MHSLSVSTEVLCCSGCTLESTSTNHSGMTKLNTPKKLRSLSYSHLPSPHALILLTSPITTCTYPTHISHHHMHLSYSHLPSPHALILLTSPITTCTYPTHISHHHMHLSYSHLPSSHALILLTSPIITSTYPTVSNMQGLQGTYVTYVCTYAIENPNSGQHLSCQATNTYKTNNNNGLFTML